MAETKSVEERIAELKEKFQAQLRETPPNVNINKNDFAKPDNRHVIITSDKAT